MALPIQHDVIGGSPEKLVVLAGPPGQLTGPVDFHNRSDVDVVLREIGLNDASGRLTSRPLRLPVSTLVLRPSQERRIQITVAVDPTTPPGDFRAELDIGARSVPVLLHVTEVFDLTVRPQSIVVLNRPGEAQRKRIILTNTGNVGFSVDAISDVDLEDDMLPDRAARVALEPCAEAAGQQIEGSVLALLRIRREGSYREAGLSVRQLGGKIDVAPGETAPIDLEITLQTDLPDGSRYRGKAPVLTEDLEIIVVSSGGDGERGAV